MKNIDKIREMSSSQFVRFMNEDKCKRCAYDGTNCKHDMCTHGMKVWLEEDAELMVGDMELEFDMFCGRFRRCEGCSYVKETNICKTAYIVNNFNIIDGKITRR